MFLSSSAEQNFKALFVNYQENKMFFIPKGFAHGFQTLTPNCQILYLHTQYHNPEAENGFFYNSPDLAIKWPLGVTCLSNRDMELPIFEK